MIEGSDGRRIPFALLGMRYSYKFESCYSNGGDISLLMND